MATKIYFVRHGESLDNVAGVTFDEMNVSDDGFLDNPLSELGERQAEAAADWLFRHVRADAVVSSGLARTDMTAAPIAERFGVEVETLPEMREVHVEKGTLSNLKIENKMSRTLYDLPGGKEIRSAILDVGVAFLFNLWAAAGLPGFESPKKLRARARYCLETLAARPERRIVAVAHNFFLGALLLELVDILPANFFRVPKPLGLLPNCSVTCVLARPPRFRLRYAAQKTSDFS
ncbi:MAG: histidine phosphatase family protein [bacterium]